MAQNEARGVFRTDSQGNILENNSGSPQEIFKDGPIAFGNLFNSGVIPHPNIFNPNENPFVPGREYYTSVTCLPETADGCIPVRFESYVTTPPANRDFRANRVVGYPELILAGTKYGVPQESIGSQQVDYSETISGVEYTDMTRTIELTCFPAFTNDLPRVQLLVDIDEFGIDQNPERDILIESWFHDTKWPRVVPFDPIFGTLNNVLGEIQEAGPSKDTYSGLPRFRNNNILLEMMVHIAPIDAANTSHTDAAGGSQNPASHYCNTVTIGLWEWEIWYGQNGFSPLIVYNRIGPAGCLGSACQTDVTNEGLIDTSYNQLLEYTINNLEQDLINCSAASQQNGFWVNPNDELYPFDRIREPNRTAVSGIEIGHEPYYNGADDEPFGFTLNRAQLTVDGKQLGTCTSALTAPGLPGDPRNNPLPGQPCSLPIQLLGRQLITCNLPLTFSALGCSLPITLNACEVNRVGVNCVECPDLEVKPRITIPYGSAAVSVAPDQFVNFRTGDTPTDGTEWEMLDAQISGITEGVFNADNLFATYQPPVTGCDVMCGHVDITYVYYCPDLQRITCSLRVDICVVPEVAQLPDETINATTGDVIFIGAEPSLAGEELIEPLVGPPVGELVWNGSGWRYVYPPGLIGRFDIIVPSSPNGGKALDTMRCVTVCLTNGRKSFVASDRACQSIFAIRDHTGRFVPVVSVEGMSLQITENGVEESIDFETGENCVSPSDGSTYSLSFSGQLRCGDDPMQTGCDVEFMLIKDARFRNSPTFFGTARIGDYSTDLSDGAAQVTRSLTGHGAWHATNWSL